MKGFSIARFFRFAVYATIAVLFTPLPSMAASDNPSPSDSLWSSITYRENSMGGPLTSDGRILRTNGSKTFGIDINSSVDIKIDSDKLRQKVATFAVDEQTRREISFLSDQIAKLREMVRGLNAAKNITAKAIKEFQKAEAQGTGGYDAFRQAAKEMGAVMENLLKVINQSIQKRLESQGVEETSAASEANQAFVKVFAGPNLELGYNWQALGEILNSEIDFAQERLEGLIPKSGLRIQIQAHLIKKDNNAYPVYLPNYNEVQIGPASIYQKVRFHLPDEEKAAFEAYEAMAEEIGEVQSAGEAFMAALKVQYELLQNDLEALFSDIRQAMLESKQRFDALAEWAKEEKRKQWLDSVRSRLSATAEGRQIIEALSEAQNIFSDIRADFEALRAYGDLKGKLSGMQPETAMDFILASLRSIPSLTSGQRLEVVGLRSLSPAVWQDRLMKIQSLIAAANALTPQLKNEILSEGSPIHDLQLAIDSVKKVIDVAENTSFSVRDWLANVFGRPPMLISSTLPVPPGQKTPEIQSELNTRFDLTTIQQPREPKEQIVVSYFFFKGEKRIGPEGRDRFYMRIFGFSDSAVASLTFTNRTDEDTFQATAAFSWILNWHRWPRSNNHGLRNLNGIDWFSGVGLTVMPLNFDPDESMELGLAGTLSFLNNYLLVGYGRNLQVSQNSEFWFFSVRFFSTSGLINFGIK